VPSAGEPSQHQIKGGLAMLFFPAVAPSVGAVVASSDGVHNFKMVRLFTMEEVIGIRKKRIELQKSYSPPGE
jgi:hypothetical protein